MFILKTERNAQGRLVFSKEKVGKKVLYLAKDESGNVLTVDSEWVWEHEYDIVNLGVSGTTFYPVKLSKNFLKCEACGKPFSVDDKHSLCSKDTLTDIDICPHCYENDCWVGSELYTVCEGCGEDSDKCWVRVSDLVDAIEDNYYGNQLRVHQVCSYIRDECYDKCDSCGYYYYYDGMDNVTCPKCRSDEN